MATQQLSIQNPETLKSQFRLPVIKITFFTVLILLRIASSTSADMAYSLVAAYALLGRRQVIEAFFMSWLFTMISPGIAPESNFASVGRYLVLAGAFASVVLRLGIQKKAPPVGSAALSAAGIGLLVFIHSMMFSDIVLVSILKIISWTLASFTIFAAWRGMNSAERQVTGTYLFGMLVLIMIVSSPLLFLPLGYLRNDFGFQGVLSHPQTFGPVMAILAVWSLTRIFTQNRSLLSLFLIFGVSFVFVLQSEARTAGLAVIIAVSMAFGLFFMNMGGKIAKALPGLMNRATIFGIFVTFLVGLAAAPQIANVVENYVTKSQRADVSSVFDAYNTSRGDLVGRMVDNIYDRPLSGIGFGIGTDLGLMEIEYDPIFNLPVSAAVEKGVVPIAILEELGILLGLVVYFWFYTLCKRAFRLGFQNLALILFILALNMGEATFFSAGGLGLLCLLVLGWAITVMSDQPKLERSGGH